jgi:hypothetical protein
MRAAAFGEKLLQLARCLVAKRDKIDRLAPLGRFLCPAGRHHLTDDSRQQRGSILPANQVEALERLVDEVEGVSAVGKGPLGLGGEQGVGECSGRKTGGDPRQQGALGRLAMANLVQRRSQRLSAADSGRLSRGALSRRGGCPSQSAATWRAPWNRAR